MKRKIISIILSMVLLLSLLLVSACEPVSPPAEIPSVGETPGAVTNVKSVWSGGDLDFTKNDGTVIMGLDGTNGDVEITSATIAAGTITSPTISGTVAGGASYTAPTLTSPTITGTGTANFTTANVTTLTVSSIATGATITTPSISSPTITGTSVVSNRQTGTGSLTAAGTSVVVTHGMSGTPTRIFLQPQGILGTAASSTGYNTVYWGTANGTAFTITAMVAANATVSIDWLAFIADE